jgi:hypothetical protein
MMILTAFNDEPVSLINEKSTWESPDALYNFTIV